jgi:hypothetical protein
LHQKKPIRFKGSRHHKKSTVMFWVGLGLMIFGAVVIWAAFSVVSMILSVIVEFIQEIIFG